MTTKSITLGAMLLAVTTNSFATNYNLEPNTCRVLPNGGLQILGVSDPDGVNLNLSFGTSMFSEVVIDRYFAVCMASVASASIMRVDYLDCSSGNCAPQANTSVQLKAP